MGSDLWLVANERSIMYMKGTSTKTTVPAYFTDVLELYNKIPRCGYYEGEYAVLPWEFME